MNNKPGDIKREIRRNCSRLTVSGLGMVLFGIWGVIKNSAFFISNRQQFIDELMSEITVEQDQIEWIESASGYSVRTLAGVMFFMIIAIINLIIMFAHLYVGLHARSEGFGRERSWFYLVIVFIMALIYFEGIFDFSGKEASYNKDVEDLVLDFAIDVTTFLTLAETLYASIRRRLLVRQLNMVTASGSGLPEDGEAA
ncbi:MAG: hypothetical protein IJ058_00300 [Lachnospiraceae bacterium]|nr:hypothetical protein [Lachnospiraceae bacterium]